MFCHKTVSGHRLLGGSGQPFYVVSTVVFTVVSTVGVVPTGGVHCWCPLWSPLLVSTVVSTVGVHLCKLRKLRFRRPNRGHSAHRDSIEHPDRVTSNPVGQPSWGATSQTSRQPASLAGQPAGPPRGASFEYRKETASVVYMI